MLEADLRRCGQRVHGLAGRDAQLRPPEIADELQDPLVHLSSGGERHLPLLPQIPPPGRAAQYPHVRCHHVDGCRRGSATCRSSPRPPPPAAPTNTLTFAVITWMAVVAGSATTCRSSPRPPPVSLALAVIARR